MKVTLDIPEGYEAKVVPTERVHKRVMEFTLLGPDHELADSLLTVITPTLMRQGWCRLFLSPHTFTVASGEKYTVMGDPE